MAEDEKGKKRRKQYKRMEKILAGVWKLEGSEPFQEDTKSSTAYVLSLSSIGVKLDEGAYRLGRHGWEEFAGDVGGVYNRHISKNTKSAAIAKTHLETAKELLGARDPSLPKVAADHCPRPANNVVSKKHKLSGVEEKTGSPQKKAKTNSNKELAEREERAVELLVQFITDRGGSASLVDGFRSRVTRKGGASINKFDVNFFDAQGQRFRSMLQVGRFFKLVNDGGSAKVRRASGGNRESQAEKNKLRKEMERLRKAHQRATKALDDFLTEETESRYPIDDRILVEEAKEGAYPSAAASKILSITPLNGPAARNPDIDGFPGIPDHFIPDILMSWDFLCTFEKAISLSPIALDDFAAALTYKPPEGQMGDDLVVPPVYLAEAHLGLLKLVLQDKYSDDWWWSTLETDESECGIQATEPEEDISGYSGQPVIKVDMHALLFEEEDPLITASWLKGLEVVRKTAVSVKELKDAIRTALKVVSNKWVNAYLRKTLEGRKLGGNNFLQKAVIFLVDTVLAARPELQDRSVSKAEAVKARDLVLDEAVKKMEIVGATAPVVTSDDVLSDVEYDDDDESDESDEEDEIRPAAAPLHESTRDAREKPASVIPPRPTPTIVDLLLPPSKPTHGTELLNAFTWPYVVGATARRILHRKKRLLNEVDDYLRSTRDLPPILLPVRREREKVVASRVLTECEVAAGEPATTEVAIEHLCSGGNYLELSPSQRLCILRLLIEAAYDTSRLYEVVNENIKQRTNAVKALDVEQRRAKKEAKEKAVADETAARDQLALEAREKFVEEKRDEIRKLNEKNKELADDVIDSLTEEDILDFDEDYKADYEALPKSDSFNKTEVKAMVDRMQEEAAFDTDSLRVLALEELVQRENRQLEEMEGEMLGLGGPDLLLDSSLDRETVRSIERLQRDIDRAKDLRIKLPELREKALAQLRDAMADGTIKALRSAIAAAKKAKLTGPDEETGGLWAVDLIRDAAVELDTAKQNKRLVDAKKDLVAKMNKCFIRSEPIGRDRFGNRFWGFENDEEGHVWAEAEYLVKGESDIQGAATPGFVGLVKDGGDVAFGARDMEEDFLDDGSGLSSLLERFSRREHHSTGFTPTLAKSHWGCLATEESIRSVIKILDGKGVRESELKAKLKDAVEQFAATDEQHEIAKEERPAGDDDEQHLENGQQTDLEKIQPKELGDDQVFESSKKLAFDRHKEKGTSSDEIAVRALESLVSGIGATVRVRALVDETKDMSIARYENGAVTAWKYHRDEVEIQDSGDNMDLEDGADIEPKSEVVFVPVWKAVTDRGHSFWLSGEELTDSLCRYVKWKIGRGYFEDDAAFFAYRNTVGRYCGKASEAPFSSSPIVFARCMVKKEAELYIKLKIGSFDNTWGGKSGDRAFWINSMKDYAFDFQTVRQGLLTLEKAFFELTAEFSAYKDVGELEPDVKALLDDLETRNDIELETIEKGVAGLWNSPASRAVFISIVTSCTTTGILALAFDLLCRNTTKYLQSHNLLDLKDESAFYEEPMSMRRTRRSNAWQQRQEVNYEEFF